jgi:tetratricopeptide (TPR) repeat protein
VLSFDLTAQTRRDGESLFNEKRYQEAYDVYEKLMVKYPKDNLLKYQVGRCLYEMGRYDEAKILFEKVVEKDVVKANYYLYDIYFSEYRFSDADLAITAYLSSLGAEGEEVEECNAKSKKPNLQ